MIKTIDLDKLSKEEKDKVASDISGGVKQAAKEKENSGTWIRTPFAIFKAERVTSVHVSNCWSSPLDLWTVEVRLKNDDMSIILDKFKELDDAKAYMNDIFEKIKEVI